LVLFVVARERGISSKAVVKEAIEEADGAVSRLELDGLRVVADDTTERASDSWSRLERVESLGRRRRRLSSSLLLLEAAELPVNRLHMMLAGFC
jgi:hypothetical protein